MWRFIILGLVIIGTAVFGFSLIDGGSGDVTANAVIQPRLEDISQYARAIEPREFHFPQDHGAHPDFQTEWWYYTGHLQAADGRKFGYELTFFRRGLNRTEQTQEGFAPSQEPSRWRIHDLYLAHFALTDLAQGQFHYAERISREGLGKAGADQDRLRVWIDRWSAEVDPSVARY